LGTVTTPLNKVKSLIFKNFMKPIYFFATLFVLVLIFFLFESMTMYPNYELRPATIVKVTGDERGFIGYDKMTIVKFEDGYVTEVGGDKGNAGDNILAYREFGTKSLFGILGDKKILK